MASIMIFAGTTEGRKIAEFLRGHAPKVYVLTATEYGKEQVEDGENIHVLAGRLDVEGMRELAYGCQAELVIDATHPFAMEVTKNIQKMCQEESISYMRVLREGSVKDGNAVWVKNIREAADYLKDKEGNVLITTGSKELAPYTEMPDYQNRCFLRVLSTKEAVQKAVENGFEGKHLIAMQGPFSQEMNEQLLRHVQAKYMVTKESGRSGGYEEKLRAAKKAGAVAVVIGRPLEKGVTLDEAFQILAEKYGFRRPRHITLVGVGPGDESLLTKAAQRAMKSADVLIGAKRMLQAAEGIAAERYEEYRADKIEEFLRINSRYRQIVILLSGDVSFYSGAAKLKETLKEYEMSVIPGISSISCMAARIGKGAEHTPLLSIHGRNCNYVDYLREYGRLFLLVSSGKEIETVLRRLCRYGYGSASVYVGSRLSYPKENLISGTAKRLSEKEKIWDGLSVMYVEIPEILVEEAPQETEDGDFIRCILESIALKVKYCTEYLDKKLGLPVEKVSVVNGGTRNYVLMQMFSDALKRPVYCGLPYATLTGNILTQFRALGELGSIDEMRELSGRSFEMREYLPQIKPDRSPPPRCPAPAFSFCFRLS